jgi:UPF0755 protein
MSEDNRNEWQEEKDHEEDYVEESLGVYGDERDDEDYELFEYLDEESSYPARPRASFFGDRTYMASEEELDLLEDEYEDYEERDFRPVRFGRRSRSGLKGGIMYGLFVISISIILACVGWVAACDVLALNKEDRTAIVIIPKEFEIQDVANQLHDAGIIEYKFLFRLFSAISDAKEKIQPGAYELSTKFDYRALIKKMQIGSDSQQTTRITIPEGYSMAQIFATLEKNGIASVDDLWDAAAHAQFTYSFLEDDNIVLGDPLRLEGFLFPDTLDFYQGERASTSINRFLSTFHYKLTADMKSQADALGLSLREAVIVASMIEKEAADDSERAAIASVIYNRIANGMRLDIDATVIYALGEHKEVLTAADLDIDSPYNTRKYTGMPPGPICNPGIASINAALQPASSNYLYYALDTATGLHRFFTNYNDHQNFVSTQNYG